MAFRIDLPPYLRQRMTATDEIIDRLYQADNLTLARNILCLSRQLRVLYREAGNHWIDDLDRPVYDTSFCWTLLPEIAFRLAQGNPSNYLRITSKERQCGDITSISNPADFRRTTTIYLHNTAFRDLAFRDKEPTPNAAFILDRLPIHGNPIEFALQRLYPAEQHAEPTYRDGKYWDMGYEIACHQARLAGNPGHPGQLKQAAHWEPRAA